MMKSSRLFFLSLAILLIWLAVVTALRTNFGSKIRFFADEYDRSFYFQRGAWSVDHQVPYRDTVSEYPQIPTYLFGLIRLFVGEENNLNTAYWIFSSFFSLVMGLVLVASIRLLYGMLPEKNDWAYLLLLPAPLYFAFNRFDILPAYLTLLSYKILQDKRWDLAAVLLGVGALTKWYPALLLPAYLVYYYKTTGQIPWRLILIFGLTCLVIILPTLISGGMDALLVPYRFHMERGTETVSLPTLFNHLIGNVFGKPINPKYLLPAFLLLQVSVVPFLLWAQPDRPSKLLNWCILIICAFILFSRIYSPQWLLWLFPFSILAAQNKRDRGLLILFGVTTYIGFPVIWDTFGGDSREMIFMGIVYIVMLGLIGWTAISRIREPKLTWSSLPIHHEQI